MVGVNNKTNCPVVIINDLDSTIKDVAFDCFILNRYGNHDKIATYIYLLVDVTDIHNVCTVIIGGSLINFHKNITFSMQTLSHLSTRGFTTNG
jgi:hypothetical protein